MTEQTYSTLLKEQKFYTETNSFPVDAHKINAETAVDIILQEIGSKRNVILEGSPIYLYPSSESGYVSQQWDNGAFLQGWAFISLLQDRLTKVGTAHLTPFVFVDEFNNIPEDYTNRDFLRRFAQLVKSSEIIESSPIGNPGENESSVIYRLESEFTRPDDSSFNICSNLDAGFQREKLIYTSNQDSPILESLRDTHLVVIHPEEFKSQQAMMLVSLLGEMKNPPFNQISKSHRREVLSDIYTHVWFDGSGLIQSLTHPVWDGNKFIHEEVVV